MISGDSTKYHNARRDREQFQLPGGRPQHTLPSWAAGAPVDASNSDARQTLLNCPSVGPLTPSPPTSICSIAIDREENERDHAQLDRIRIELHNSGIDISGKTMLTSGNGHVKWDLDKKLPRSQSTGRAGMHRPGLAPENVAVQTTAFATMSQYPLSMPEVIEQSRGNIQQINSRLNDLRNKKTEHTVRELPAKQNLLNNLQASYLQLANRRPMTSVEVKLPAYQLPPSVLNTAPLQKVDAGVTEYPSLPSQMYSKLNGSGPPSDSIPAGLRQGMPPVAPSLVATSDNSSQNEVKSNSQFDWLNIWRSGQEAQAELTRTKAELQQIQDGSKQKDQKLEELRGLLAVKDQELAEVQRRGAEQLKELRLEQERFKQQPCLKCREMMQNISSMRANTLNTEHSVEAWKQEYRNQQAKHESAIRVHQQQLKQYESENEKLRRNQEEARLWEKKHQEQAEELAGVEAWLLGLFKIMLGPESCPPPDRGPLLDLLQQQAGNLLEQVHRQAGELTALRTQDHKAQQHLTEILRLRVENEKLSSSLESLRASEGVLKLRLNTLLEEQQAATSKSTMEVDELRCKLEELQHEKTTLKSEKTVLLGQLLQAKTEADELRQLHSQYAKDDDYMVEQLEAAHAKISSLEQMLEAEKQECRLAKATSTLQQLSQEPLTRSPSPSAELEEKLKRAVEELDHVNALLSMERQQRAQEGQRNNMLLEDLRHARESEALARQQGEEAARQRDRAEEIVRQMDGQAAQTLALRTELDLSEQRCLALQKDYDTLLQQRGQLQLQVDQLSLELAHQNAQEVVDMTQALHTQILKLEQQLSDANRAREHLTKYCHQLEMGAASPRPSQRSRATSPVLDSLEGWQGASRRDHEVQELMSRWQEAAQEVERLSIQVMELSKGEAKLVSQYQACQCQAQLYQQQLEALKAQLGNTSDVQQLQDEIRDLREKLEMNTRDMDHQKRTIEDYEANITAMEIEQQGLQHDYDQLRQVHNEMLEQLEQLKEANGDLQQKLTDLGPPQSRIQALDNELTQVKYQLEVVRRDYRSLKEDRDALAEECRALEEQNHELDGQRETLRQELLRMQHGDSWSEM